MDTTGPRSGEVWTVGAFSNLRFVGVARDILGMKHFVFEDPVDGLFVISKDEFFAADMPREKECNANSGS